MILTQPQTIARAAGAIQLGIGYRPPEFFQPQQPVSVVYTGAPATSSSSGGLLQSLQDKWSALSTVGKVAVAGGGAVALVLVLSALGGKKRR